MAASQDAVPLETLPVTPGSPGDAGRGGEGGLRVVLTTELVEQDPPADVGGGEARAPIHDLVVDGESLVVAARVDEHRGEPDAERGVVRMQLDAPAEGLLGTLEVACVVARHREPIPRLLVRGIELDGAREGLDGGPRPPPAQEARAHHAVCVRGSRRRLDGVAVREERLVIASLKLPRMTDEHARQRRPRPEARDGGERVARPRIALGRHLRAAEREPRVRVVRPLRGDPPERARGGLEIASYHRASPVAHRPAAPREEEREQCLTAPAAERTMRAMERSLIEKILDAAPGIEKGDSGYRTAEDHRASLYLGAGGGTTVLGDLVRIALHDDYVECEANDHTVHCVTYEPIFGLALRRPRDERGQRTGF